MGIDEFYPKLDKDYPGAYAVFSMISNNFNDMCEKYLPKSSQPEDIIFHVRRDSTGLARLEVNKETALFLMAISESVLQLVNGIIDPKGKPEDVESKLKEDIENNPIETEKSTNMCPKCGKVNPINTVRCSVCGTKLL